MELIEDGGGGVVARDASWWDRLAARLYADRLDRRLAAGVPPEASVQTSLRGRALTHPVIRRRLADGIERAIATAAGTAPVPRSPIFIDRAAVRDALPELLELHDRLDSDPLPSARGMARARLLLTDGTGPMFNRDVSYGLRETIRVVLDGFDPR